MEYNMVKMKNTIAPRWWQVRRRLALRHLRRDADKYVRETLRPEFAQRLEEETERFILEGSSQKARSDQPHIPDL